MTDRRQILVSMLALAAGSVARPALALAAKLRWPIPPQPPRVPTTVGSLGSDAVSSTDLRGVRAPVEVVTRSTEALVSPGAKVTVSSRTA